MPAFPDIVDPARANLIAYLRTLHARGETEVTHMTVQLADGGSLTGTALNRSATGIQLLGEDKKVHLLRKTSDGRYRAVTSQQDWPSYNGDTVGYRYSRMTQITPANANQLAPVWINTVLIHMNCNPHRWWSTESCTSLREMKCMPWTRAAAVLSGTISVRARKASAEWPPSESIVASPSPETEFSSPPTTPILSR